MVTSAVLVAEALAMSGTDMLTVTWMANEPAFEIGMTAVDRETAVIAGDRAGGHFSIAPVDRCDEDCPHRSWYSRP